MSSYYIRVSIKSVSETTQNRGESEGDGEGEVELNKEEKIRI